VNFFSNFELELYNYSIKYFHITFIGIRSKKKNLACLISSSFHHLLSRVQLNFLFFCLKIGKTEAKAKE
jgi:hypothetical protein